MLNQLENIRTELNYSQKQFAENALNMSLSGYKRLISNQTSKYNDTLTLIENLYKHTGLFAFPDLFDNYGSDPLLNLMHKIAHLPKHKLRSVINYVDILSEVAPYFSEADKMEAIVTIGRIYHKVIKMDLTHDKYYPITVNKEEWDSVQNKTQEISVWFKRFCEEGYVHSDDLEDFKAFTNLANLRRLAKREHHYIRYRYRRKVGNEWRWVCMEIVRSPEYTPKRQTMFAYIRDIDDDYMD